MSSLLTEQVKQRRFSVQEYYQMAAMGIFHPTEHLEPIATDKIVTISPQNPPHTSTTARVGDYLRLATGLAKIRSQESI